MTYIHFSSSYIFESHHNNILSIFFPRIWILPTGCYCQLSLRMWEIDSFPSNQDAGLVSLSGLGWPKAMTRVNKEASWQVSYSEQKPSCNEVVLIFPAYETQLPVWRGKVKILKLFHNLHKETQKTHWRGFQRAEISDWWHLRSLKDGQQKWILLTSNHCNDNLL